MTVGDAVFPLPDPGFLFIHALTAISQAAAAVVVDAEGRWKHAAGVSAAFNGYLTAPNPREVDRAMARGVVLDAVALAPRAAPVAETDRIVAAGVDQWLDGTYLISLIRPNLSHLRLLLTRIPADTAPAHGP